MNTENYTFGKSVGSWHADRAQTVTLVVTDDCNLRCKYCYITHKKSDNKMDFDAAKAFIDRLLVTDEMRNSEAIILEFIGGKPLIEANLIDRINYNIDLCHTIVRFHKI